MSDVLTSQEAVSKLVGFIESIESTLAEMSEQIGFVAGLDSPMAEMVAVMEAIRDRKGVDLSPLIEAMRDARPVVTVNVPPVAAPEIRFMPAPAAGTWEIRRPAGYGQPDAVVATIKRVA